MLHALSIPGFQSIGTRIHRAATLPRMAAPACPMGLFRFRFVRNPYHRLLSFCLTKVFRMADPGPRVNATLPRRCCSCIAAAHRLCRADFDTFGYADEL